MGALKKVEQGVNNAVQSVSDTVSHVGQVIASSPLAQAAISAGAAILTGGASIPLTAGLIGANQVAQGGSLQDGLLAGGASYLAGTGANAASGLLGGGSAATGAAGMGGGTGLTLGAAGETGLTLGGSGAAATGMGGGTGLLGSLGTAGAATGALGAAGSLIPGISNQSLLTGGLNIAGSYLNQQAASDAAATQAQAQIRAAQIAADAAKFRPIGVTTNFGSSKFGYDANGNLVSAGYSLSPEMKAQQDKLLAQSGGLLNQAGQAQAQTAPMVDASGRMMSLGNSYLATDPQAQAAKYYADQQAILAPQRAQDMAALQAQMQAQGRGGFAIGGGVGGQGAANPQLQALLNAQMQQNTQLSANATQGGMDYANFGADMVGRGGNMLSAMYGVQNSAYNPYNTAIDAAGHIENMGQNTLTQGINIGAKGTASTAAAGMLTSNGITDAAATMAPSNAYSPWGALLTGGANAMSNYKFDPLTGKAL